MSSETTTHVLYLHGFKSSPLSAKAQATAAAVAAQSPGVTWWCPQLPPSPREAMALLEQGTATWPRAQTAVIGSSLGGYYATWLAEKWGCKAVLLNPAVEPARDLASHLGVHAFWHTPGESFVFLQAHVIEMRELRVPHISRPARYYAVIAQGDEVLDWREMRGHYPGCAGVLLEGGDHGISDYAEHLPGVLRFLNLAG